MERDYKREAVVSALWTLLEEGLLTPVGGHYDAFWSYLKAYDEKQEARDQLQLDLDITDYGRPRARLRELPEQDAAPTDDKERQQA